MWVVHLSHVLYPRKFKKLVPLCVNGHLVFQHEDYRFDIVDKSPKLLWDAEETGELFHILHHVIEAPKTAKRGHFHSTKSRENWHIFYCSLVSFEGHGYFSLVKMHVRKRGFSNPNLNQFLTSTLKPQLIHQTVLWSYENQPKYPHFLKNPHFEYFGTHYVAISLFDLSRTIGQRSFDTKQHTI